MHRILVLPLLLVLAVSQSVSAVTGTAHPGDIHTHHYGGSSEVGRIDIRDPMGWLGQPCTDDIFYVTATLRLLEPSADEALLLTTDHAGVPPAVVVTAVNPSAQITVRLGGCDRGFTAVVVGLASLDGAQYQLTWS